MLLLKIIAGVFLYLFGMFSITFAVSVGVQIGMKRWFEEK